MSDGTADHPQQGIGGRRRSDGLVRRPASARRSRRMRDTRHGLHVWSAALLSVVVQRYQSRTATANVNQHALATACMHNTAAGTRWRGSMHMRCNMTALLETLSRVAMSSSGPRCIGTECENKGRGEGRLPPAIDFLLCVSVSKKWRFRPRWRTCASRARELAAASARRARGDRGACGAVRASPSWASFRPPPNST